MVEVEAVSMSRTEVTEVVFEMTGPDDERVLGEPKVFQKPFVVEEVILTTTEDLNTSEHVVLVEAVGTLESNRTTPGRLSFSTHPLGFIQPLADAPQFILDAFRRDRDRIRAERETP